MVRARCESGYGLSFVSSISSQALGLLDVIARLSLVIFVQGSAKGGKRIIEIMALAGLLSNKAR